MDKELLKPFDAIRPFEPEELPEVFERLLGNAQFAQVVAYVFKDVPFDMLAQKMRACKTNLEFQVAFCYPFIKGLLQKASLGCDMNVDAIDMEKRYTFVSNHRDIVLDSALLDVLLVDAGCKTTCEIAIGDNLLSLPWVKDLVRINKSFIVERSVSLRQMLLSSKRLSDYMHLVIAQKHDNVWIAQREGRAKDSNDRTQESIIKMMVMGGEGSLVERLKGLHIVPLAISYEYDPCDFLKAQEFQLKRDIADWKKGPMDDVVSMQTGIMGYKGRIHYQCAPCIDTYLTATAAALPKGEFFDAVAAHIDKAIHQGYRLFPNNLIAAHLLTGEQQWAGTYTAEEKKSFETYLKQQINRIEMPQKDIVFLQEKMLEMYANPAINHKRAVGE